MIYFIFLSYLLLLSSIPNRNQGILLTLFAIVLIFLSGFRAIDVGTDTIHYKTYFDRIASGENLSVEIGWITLNKIIQLFDGSYQLLVFLVSLLTIIPIYFTLKKHSVNPLFSLFLYFTLYFYFYSFNISRQTLAISFVLLAFTYLLNKKKVVYILLILLASTFHTSALITLPLLFVHKIPDIKIIYVVSIVIAAFIGLLSTNLIFSQISHTAYSGYVDKIELKNVAGNASYLLILNTFFIFILLITKKRELFFKIFFIYVVLSNLIIRIPFSNRLLLYFAIIQILYLPQLIYNSEEKNKPILISIIILYAYIIFMTSLKSGDIFPYSNVLF